MSRHHGPPGLSALALLPTRRLSKPAHTSHLPLCAQKIGEEIGSQGQALEALQNRTENTAGRIENMNTKSQLRWVTGRPIV